MENGQLVVLELAAGSNQGRGGEGSAVDRKLPIPGWSDADRSVVRRLV